MTPEVIKIDTNAEIKTSHYPSGRISSKTPNVNGKNMGWIGYDGEEAPNSANQCGWAVKNMA